MNRAEIKTWAKDKIKGHIWELLIPILVTGILTGLTIGQKYTIDIDITEYLQQAFIYGVQNGYLTNCKWQNMKIYYMNLGWELPGEYKVKSTISNLDIYYEED